VTRSAESLDGLAFVDIETTGLDPAKDEIVEVGVCFVERGTVVARRSWVICPTQRVPAVITALTGLTDDEVRAAPSLVQRAAEIAEALRGWTMVAHNASFEQAFLRELTADLPCIDSCEVTHLLFPELASHALDALVRWADVGDGARHRALEDAEDTFLVLKAAFERVATNGRRAELERLVRRLSPPQSPSAEALVRVLARLSTHCLEAQPPVARAPITRLVDETLVGRFMASLHDDRFELVDVERDSTEALIAAARRVGERTHTTVTVALPAKRLRESQEVTIPRRQICRTALRALLDSPAVTDETRRARAWLEVWSNHVATGDPASHSGWMGERVPEARAMLQLARGCTCLDPSCFVRRTEAATDRAPVVVVSHELALDWLERGAPLTLLVANAEALPDAERRRSALLLDARRAQSLSKVIAVVTPTHPLLATLSTFGTWLTHLLDAEPVSIDAARRGSRVWLDVRDLLLGLQKDLAHALAGPLLAWTPLVREFADEVSTLLTAPGPAFELIAGQGQLQRRLRSPAAVLGPRLRPRMLLVSAVRGGTRWCAGSASWVPPAVVPWSVESVATPVSLESLAMLATRLAHDAVVLVVSHRSTEALAQRLVAQRVPLRLVSSARALRGRGVLLGRWSDAPLPDCTHVLLDGAPTTSPAAWRSALLACGSRHVTLTSEAGVSDATSAELADLVASAGVRHVLAR
jgi:DNA polymerase III epsilon subunit-like protein